MLHGGTGQGGEHGQVARSVARRQRGVRRTSARTGRSCAAMRAARGRSTRTGIWKTSSSSLPRARWATGGSPGSRTPSPSRSARALGPARGSSSRGSWHYRHRRSSSPRPASGSPASRCAFLPTHLTYPWHWHYTFLRGLDYLRLTPAIADERLADPIELLREKRNPNVRGRCRSAFPGRSSSRWRSPDRRVAGTQCWRFVSCRPVDELAFT